MGAAFEEDEALGAMLEGWDLDFCKCGPGRDRMLSVGCT